MNNDPNLPPKDEHHRLAVWILVVLAVLAGLAALYMHSEGMTP